MKKMIAIGTLIFLFSTFNNLAGSAKNNLIHNKDKFQEITGKNLENKEYKLPGDFEGKLNLVFVAFLREQQTQVDKWIPLAGSLTKKYDNLHYYELPVLSESYNLARWFIDGGMRAGIHDKSARERTITVYTNKKNFLTSLSITEDKDIHILLLDQNGKIIWRDKGEFTTEKADSLQSVLNNQK